jgi:hypothetical protein
MSISIFPRIINFQSIGSAEIGYISVAQEFDKIPFQIKRVFWTYYTPQNVSRGGHASISKELVLVAVAGSIVVETEMKSGLKNTFELSNPYMGLYIPKLSWHTMKYTHNSVQMCIASSEYDENDYIRDYEIFKNY